MIFEKIRERLQELRNEACFPCDFVSESQGKVYNYFESKLKEILKLMDEYNNGWIPCSERLPEPRRKILVLDTKKEIHITYYDDGNECFWGKGDIYMINATHWQPLPQPPKGE